MNNMFHATQREARQYLNSGNFIPVLKALHRIVPCTRFAGFYTTSEGTQEIREH